MSTPTDEDTVMFPKAEQPPHRPLIARLIRKFAIPVILAWIGIIVFLGSAVPSLDEVGKMRSVSMSPDQASSMIAMKRVGEVFEEFKSNSSVMIVLATNAPLDSRELHRLCVRAAAGLARVGSVVSLSSYTVT